MTTRLRSTLSAEAERALAALSDPVAATGLPKRNRASAGVVAALIAADLVAREPGGRLALTPSGHAHVARSRLARAGGEIDPFVGQHLALARARQPGPGRRTNLVNDSESPLAWLARRKGRSGRPMIDAHQLMAGEKLRLEFTRAQLMPRITSNWQAAVSDSARTPAGGQSATITDVIVAARQGVRRALDAVGPEFAGLLVDVCCFLKGLEDIERERRWPPRSAKIVLQLGLDRLARHYGLSDAARGKARADIRTWLAPDAAFGVESV